MFNTNAALLDLQTSKDLINTRLDKFFSFDSQDKE